MFPNVFEDSTTNSTLERLEKLTFDTQPQWGKMNASQMLAHLNVAYDMAYTEKQSKSSWFTKFLMKAFVKGIVVGEKPYAKNSRTAPQFLITTEKEFSEEKAKFIDNVKKTQENGAKYFEGRESASFGALTAKQWSNMFSKHIEHHFAQFGV